MFVDIEKFESALAIENLLMPYKKGRLAPDKKARLPKEPITREVCMEVLQSTNYARNIKDMLQCIADLPSFEQAQFKDVVLACFANREQSDEVFKIAEKLAQNSDYEAELRDEVNKTYNERFFYSANYLKEAVSTTERTMKPEWQKAEKIVFCGASAAVVDQMQVPPELEFFQVNNVSIAGSNMSGVNSVYVRDTNYFARLSELKNFSASLTLDNVGRAEVSGMDFSKSPQVRFLSVNHMDINKSKGFPQVLDLSSVKEVVINKSDLDGVNCIKISPNWNQLTMTETLNLPDDMNFQKMEWVDFYRSSWKNAQNISFQNIVGYLRLGETTHLPKNIQIKHVGSVLAEDADFQGVKTLEAKNIRSLILSGAKNLSMQMDFKNCDRLLMQRCDLSQVRGLDLGEVKEELHLANSCGLPKDFNISGIRTVSCYRTNFDGVEKIDLKKGQKLDMGAAENLKANVDVSDYDEVAMSHIDFHEVKRLKVEHVYKLFDCSDAMHLPQNLTFSDIGKALFQNTQFGDTQSVKFKDITKVDMNGATDTPKMIVMRNVDKFNAPKADFSQTESLFCRGVASAVLTEAQQLPKKMVFENCDEVTLGGNNVVKVDEIEFNNVRKVCIGANSQLPKKLDFSKVDELQLSDGVLAGADEVIFKNRKQMKACNLNSVEGAKVRFADEERNLLARLGLKKFSR